MNILGIIIILEFKIDFAKILLAVIVFGVATCLELKKKKQVV